MHLAALSTPTSSTLLSVPVTAASPCAVVLAVMTIPADPVVPSVDLTSRIVLQPSAERAFLVIDQTSDLGIGS